MGTVRRLNNEINFTIGRNDLPKALREMRGFKDQVAKVGKEFDSFTNRMKAMQQSAISTNHTFSELGKTLVNIKTDGAVNQVNNLRKTLKGANEDVKNLRKTLKGATEDVKKMQTTQAGGGGITGGGSRGGRVSKAAGFGEINRQLGTAAFSYGFGNFLRKSIYDTYEMEETRARLQKISGQDISGEELVAYQKLNDQKNAEMSRKYAVSRKEIYDLQASVSESGFGASAQQPLAIGITEQILQASKLFALPVEEAKKSILKLVQQAQITDATVLEEWIARINLMEQQIPGGGKDILQFMSRSAGSGKLIGLNPDQIVAMSALGTALSSSTYMGATAQRAILTKIGQSSFTTRQAKGLEALGYKDIEEVEKGVWQSKKYNKIANEQGPFAAILELFKSIRELSLKGKEGSVERNTSRRAAMEAVINFLGQGLKTENATKMATSLINELGLGGKLEISKLESLYSSLQETTVDANGNKVLKRDSVKEIELARTMESQRFKMESFVKAWENFRIAFVEEVLPFFTDILNATIVPALYAFGKLPKIIKYVLVFATALMALVLPLMIIVTGFATLAGILGGTGGVIVGGLVAVIGVLTWFAEKVAAGEGGVFANIKNSLIGAANEISEGMNYIKEKWNGSLLQKTFHKIFEVLIAIIDGLNSVLFDNPIIDLFFGFATGKNVFSKDYWFPEQGKTSSKGQGNTMKPEQNIIQSARTEEAKISSIRNREFLTAIERLSMNDKKYSTPANASTSPLAPANSSPSSIIFNINGAGMSPNSISNSIVDKLSNFLNLKR